MRCDEVHNRLDEYLDGVLTATERAAVAGHLEGCAACRSDERALRRVVDGARGLPAEVAPARDLWPAIERQITGATVRQGWFGRSDDQAAGGRRLIAAAAVLVAALGAVVGLLIVRESGRAGAGRGVGEPGTISMAVEPAMQEGGAEEFVRARTELRAVLEARRADLSPATREVIDRNLAVIEQAASEIETAMANDPGNQHLRGLLLAVYRQEIELLLRAAKLPAAS
jgi:hypothetical protein